jgi:hypothetical protein
MRRSTVLFATLAIGFGLAASRVQAQAVSGTPFLSNIDPNNPNDGYSGDWASVTKTNVLSTATGLEFQVNNGVNPTTGGENANTFSTAYFPLSGNQITPLNAGDDTVIFNFTWNSGNAVNGVNILFALDDSNGGTNYYDAINPAYSLLPQPGQTYTFTAPLQSPNQANITGGAVVNGLNFQIDPANVYGPYDITFNSIALVPEPATFGIGTMAMCFLAARRNRKATVKA